MTGTGKNKPKVARGNYVEKNYRDILGNAVNELFAQFFIRVYCELPGAVLAEFSKLKILQAPNFKKFRNVFQAELKSLFLVPADTFDNVKGQFPIGFHIWDTTKKEVFEQITADVYDKEGTPIGTKTFYSSNERQSLNQWWTQFASNQQTIGLIANYPPDFQNQNKVCLISRQNARYCMQLTAENLMPCVVYFAVRQCIKATWLNDRDQFLYPADSWRSDTEFQNDCLAYTLFHGQNRISSAAGVNHWLPFTEQEVGAAARFDSHFMTDFILGRRRAATPPPPQQEGDVFAQDDSSAAAVAPAARSVLLPPPQQPLVFSAEAQAVFAAGRALWQYYHAQHHANPNASFYDIRLHFQGSNNRGNMNPTSTDSDYNRLIAALRQAQAALAEKIARAVYRHAFLLP